MQSEIAATRDALALFPAGMSARSKAHCLARRVVAQMVDVDRCDDPLEMALARAAVAIARDPVALLADEHIPDMARERLRRFEGRGCSQLSDSAWRLETDEIAVLLEKRLTEKFRRS